MIARYIVSQKIRIKLDGEWYMLEEGDEIEVIDECGVTTGDIAIAPQPATTIANNPIKKKKRKKKPIKKA